MTGAATATAVPRGTVTALLAEDEPLLADELADCLLQLWPQLEIVARASDGLAALQAIEAHAPDIAFLDIQMPKLTGLEVAQKIGARCHVVFITAFDQHALTAFEAGAIDYVLKPLSMSRLLTTVERLKLRVAQAAPDLSRLALPAPGTAPGRGGEGGYLQWIRASRGTALRLVTVEEVCYFKADSKYTLVVTPDSESVIRKTIRELEDELDPHLFWRIHRAVLVNVRAIDSVLREGAGALAVRLKQRPETLTVSEPHQHLFRQM